MHTKLIIITLLAMLLSVHGTHFIPDIKQLVESLKIKTPKLIHFCSTYQILIMKELSSNNMMARVEEFSRSCQDLNQDMVILINNINDLEKVCLSKSGKLLVMLDGVLHHEVKDQLKIAINQEVYLYETESKSLFEFYQVNNVKVERKIGELDELGQFIWLHDVQKKYFITIL